MKEFEEEKGRHLHSSQKSHIDFLATFEPSSFEEANQNKHWVAAMKNWIKARRITPGN